MIRVILYVERVTYPTAGDLTSPGVPRETDAPKPRTGAGHAGNAEQPSEPIKPERLSN